MLPESYKNLIRNNPKLECVKWNQYYSHDGSFTIDGVEILGELSEKELCKCSNDISEFLNDYGTLIELFGTFVTVKLSGLTSIEIEENF